MTLSASHNTQAPEIASELAYALRALVEIDMIDARAEDRFEAIHAANRALQKYTQFDRSF